MYIEAGRELDNIGAQCGINRQQGEGDATYRARIIATGGPAFGEFKQVGECSIKTGGISVRDYFAAKAMQGFLSGPMNRVEFEGDADVARISYVMADAMLAARGESK